MPKNAWIQDRKRDYYYKKAKQEKYRSRASYKLFQAIKKYEFIEHGDVVVDLGAAPGGWIQAARKTVGNKGFVLGVDLKPIEPFTQSYVRTIICDITDREALKQILEMLPRKADAVISDAAPNISGIWEVDHARQMELSQQALEIAKEILKPSGSFFVKVFQGDMLSDFIQKVKQNFVNVVLVKPEASRAKSAEIFILGRSLKNQ
ncbi:MAG TPA: RlmE family RNA methyltransferase [Patescibacteria group bacterium]|nr:RlmE family RNA methyltransferase [Patescibacteria group bacterium]